MNQSTMKRYVNNKTGGIVMHKTLRNRFLEDRKENIEQYTRYLRVVSSTVIVVGLPSLKYMLLDFRRPYEGIL